MTDLSAVHDKSNVLGQVLAQRERVAARLAHIQRVVAVMSGKGGVGKSALTANLAAALAMQGRAVGVLDADIHGASAAAMLGARKRNRRWRAAVQVYSRVCCQRQLRGR